MWFALPLRTFCLMAWHFNGLCFPLRLIDVYRGIQKCLKKMLLFIRSNNKNSSTNNNVGKNGYNNDDR